MMMFLRLLADKNKAASLLSSCEASRTGVGDTRVFHVDPQSFRRVPGAPFAYWVSEGIHATFQSFPALHAPDQRNICSTNPLNADFRYVRLWWETDSKLTDPDW